MLVVGDRESGLLVDGEDTVVFVSSGEQGPPGRDGGGDYLEFPFQVASSVVINHNFGRRPNVAVLSPGSMLVIAGVLHVSINQVQLDFASPQSGLAILSA
jgi:hypothetical protein